MQSATQPLIPSLLRQVGSRGKVTAVPKTTVLMSSSPGSDSSKAGLAWSGNGHAFFASLLLLLPQDLREEGSTFCYQISMHTFPTRVQTALVLPGAGGIENILS